MPRSLAPLMLALVTCLTAAARPEEPATVLAIDLAAPGDVFHGWGTSLSWWAHGVGGWPEETVDRIVHLVADVEEGLGLTVFRYNIGGGDQPGHSHMRRWGDVPGFKASADAPYNWPADANQRRVLLKLAAVAHDPIFEAFAVSPPWWMTRSGCSSGGVGAEPNLLREHEHTFAEYLADVARYFRDAHGVTFQSVEPLNEPDPAWWRAGGNQEGCVVPRDQQARLVRALRAALDARGLTATLVSAPDANTVDDALETLAGFDGPTLKALGQVNTHSYKASDGARAALHAAARERGKPLWQSETGPLYVGGTQYEQVLKVAERIVIDLNELRPQVWCMWQAVAEREWGCLQEDPENQTFAIGHSFHMYRAFTRHIRPGDRILPLSSDRVLAAVSDARGEAVVVLVNRDRQPRRFRLEFRPPAAAALPAAADAAQLVEATELTAATPVALRGGVVDTTVPAESVTRLLLRDMRRP